MSRDGHIFNILRLPSLQETGESQATLVKVVDVIALIAAGFRQGHCDCPFYRY